MVNESELRGASTSEEIFVEQARGGSMAAFNQLVLRYQARAYNVAYHLLGDSDAAADATQDSFLKAFRHLGKFGGGAFQAWLLRIVTNTCYDELRRRRRHAGTVPLEYESEEGETERPLPDPGETPEHRVLRREQAERIHAAINTLQPDQRAVLVLADIEGLEYNEIAEALGVPIGTVKSRLARARGHLRARLEAERSARPRVVAWPAAEMGR